MTEKQQRFVEEYLVDLNATQAAIRAGYSEKTAYSIGHENLTKPDVLAAVVKARAKQQERTQVDADWVVERLIQNYERAMQLEPVHDRKGEPTGELQWAGPVANRALELLGKHLAMFTDRVELDGDLPAIKFKLTDDEGGE